MFQAFLGSYFNSRPSARGDAAKARRMARRSHFNSRPSARGDVSKSGALVMNEISIHAPPRGATRTTRRSLYADVFQFTPLREGRPSTGNPAVQCQYFNSRPSARGDVHHSHIRLCRLISIHAPPRGATILRLNDPKQDPPISIHAPPRGATEQARIRAQKLTHFNSRPSARGDWRRCSKSPRKSTISIHAPPRGATADVQRIIAALRRFQFTPLREGRQALFSYISTQKISIHAPPRGATAWRADATPAHYFNSRPSARGDCIRRVTSSGVMDISIHAPPRGATPTSILISRQSEFQFTPLREGRRRDAAEIRRKLYISIHAPPRGATAHG